MGYQGNQRRVTDRSGGACRGTNKKRIIGRESPEGSAARQTHVRYDLPASCYPPIARRKSLEPNRRNWLKFGAASVVAAAWPVVRISAQSAQSCAPTVSQVRSPSNGGSCPYPITWLDKNGNHNQSPMANVELSNIFHFKGKLARGNGFHGMGTDNKGNRLAWGTPTTDYSYMAGEYWAARQGHQAIFAHT